MSKIEFSKAERGMMQDASWLLTKRAIMQKMELWLQVLCNHFVEGRQAKHLPFKHVWEISPKLSKGEAYRGLPWLMLDYPRYFGQEGHMAIRVFFWWGNFIGIYLHTSELYARKILAAHSLDWKGWEVGEVVDPYCFEENAENLVISGESPFFRAAKRYPLESFSETETSANLKADYQQLLKLIAMLED